MKLTKAQQRILQVVVRRGGRASYFFPSYKPAARLYEIGLIEKFNESWDGYTYKATELGREVAAELGLVEPPK